MKLCCVKIHKELAKLDGGDKTSKFLYARSHEG